jgi:protein ImuB
MTHPAELFACLYAREFPAQAMLRLRPELRHKAVVVMEGEPPLQAVCSLNSKAASLGIVRGMTAVEIDTFSSVSVLARSRIEEEAAKAALLECADTFSPRVEDRSDDGAFVGVIDIAGTGKLFGPPVDLAKPLLGRVRALSITTRIAASSNFHTAVCVALGMSPHSEATIVAPGRESEALSTLPVAVLDLDEAHAETFSLWGIRTLGMLAALPEKALIARMGQEGKRLWQLSRGELPHLFLPVEPAFALEERMEFDTPLELLDSLLFVIGVMLEQLILRAGARMLALASVSATLFLEGGASHTRTVKPALPTNDRLLWLKLLQLDLEAHPPQAAILSLTLTAEPGSTSKVQLGLFSPQLPEPTRLDVTLARIRAIVGEDCVGRAVLKDTHQSDGFCMEPFTVPVGMVSEPTSSQSRAAMRQLRPAESIAVSLRENRPETFFFRYKKYVVERAYGPWLTSGDWWSPMLWSIQQWDLIARADDGTLLSCCVTRTQGGWQLVGLYD